MFNMRLTGLTSRNWMIAHWAFFALLVVYVVTAISMNVFQCSPPSANFDHIAAGKLPTQAKCMSELNLTVPLNVVHAVTDFCLLAVPIIVLWNVRFPWSKKLRLYCVFSIGIMSCIGSVVRQIPPRGSQRNPLGRCHSHKSQISADHFWRNLSLLQPRRYLDPRRYHLRRPCCFPPPSQRRFAAVLEKGNPGAFWA